MQNAVFLIGCTDTGGGIAEENVDILTDLARMGELNVTVVVAVESGRFSGREKNIKLSDIRKERERVIKEINEASPDYVFCFGRTAASCAFNKGSVVLDQYRRTCVELPDITGQIAILDSLSRCAIQPGVTKWLGFDLMATLHGMTETKWGDYEVLTHTDPCPAEYVGLRCGTVVGFDLETYPGLDPWAKDARIRMAQVSIEPGKAVVVQAGPNSELPEWLLDIMKHPGLIKAGSNIAFDYKWCARFGYPVVSMWDTATAEHVLDATDPNIGLKQLTFRYLPRLADYSREQMDLVKERGGWEHVRDDEQYDYAAADAEASVAAALAQRDQISADPDLYRAWKLSKDVYPVLAKMQERGMCVDMTVNAEINAEMESHLGKLRREICAVLGPINPASPQELSKALTHSVKGIDLREAQWKRILSDDEDEDVSTSRKILEREASKHPVIHTVLEFRKWSKLQSSFVTALAEKHAVEHGGKTFIHPSFLLSRTETYRLASSNPNAQQLPRKPGEDDSQALNVKRQFISRFDGGQLLNADYAQMEVRVAAMLSKDAALIKALNETDVHQATAALMLNKKPEDVTEDERQFAKTVGFATIYGAGTNTISGQLNISKEQAGALIDSYFKTYPGLKRYIGTVHNHVHKHLSVTTPFGFKRSFRRPPKGIWNCWDGFRVQRQAFNTVVQSAAACVMYCALVDIERYMRAENMRSVLIGTVHDSLMVDVYPGEMLQVQGIVTLVMKNPYLMEAKMERNVPLGVDLECGENWGEMKEID